MYIIVFHLGTMDNRQLSACVKTSLKENRKKLDKQEIFFFYSPNNFTIFTLMLIYKGENLQLSVVI